MLTLTVPSIKDYRVCALYYNYKYVEQLSNPLSKSVLLAQKFEETMKRIATFFFYKKLGGIEPSYGAMLNRWEKLWFPNKDAFDISSERTNIGVSHVSYASMAAASLLQFYKDFAGRDYIPLMIEEDFVVPLSKTVKLEGQFDVVLRYPDHTNQVIKLVASEHKPTLVKYMYEMAALKYAYEYRNDTPQSATYHIYDMASTTPGFIDLSVESSDVNALKFWANTIGESTFFAPRRNLTAYCKGCPFDKECSNFQFPPWQEIAHNGG